MEQLILKVINSYSSLVANEAMFERHLEARENTDMQDALTTVKMQIGAIESWFALLSVEERVIFRQVLLGDDNAVTANRIAATRWAQKHLVIGESLLQIRKTAIQKVISFADMHSKLMLELFENI